MKRFLLPALSLTVHVFCRLRRRVRRAMPLAGSLALALLTACDWPIDIDGNDLTETSGDLELCSFDTTDPIDVSDASIDGDVLTLEIGHGGGCEEHFYRLCWDGSVAESAPPQVWLALQHDANGDTCEAYLQDTLSFSIETLREAPDGSLEEGGEYAVHVEGFSLEYAY